MWSKIDRCAEQAIGIAHAILVVVALYAIVPFLLLSFSAQPMEDDFCVADFFLDSGVLGGVYDYYLNWSGRYSGIAILGFVYRYLDLIDHYGFVVLFLFLVSWGVMVFFVIVLLRARKVTFSNCIVGIVMLLWYLTQMDATAQGFYWVVSAVQYQLGNVLILLLLCMVLLMNRTLASGLANDDFVKSHIWLIGLVIFLLIGITEVFLIPALTLILSAHLWHRSCGKAHSNIWLWLFGLAVVCTLITVLAPGNGSRGETTAFDSGQLGFALSNAWVSAWLQLKEITSQPNFWWGSFAWCFYLSANYSHDENTQRPSSSLVAIVSIACALTLFVVLFVPWWATGEGTFPRISNMAVFLFLMTWVSLISLISQRHLFWGRVGLTVLPYGAFRSVVYLIALLGLCIELSTHQVVTTARTDLTTRSYTYKKLHESRYALARIAGEQDAPTLRLPPLSIELPTTIAFHDLSVDAKALANACFAQYFRIPEVTVN
ncbi:MAG: hypothetical protein P8J68_10645 [Arenicellaceae bacterium]|nr:hypothetical protein [Arenicellaceae bacterium]